MAKYCKFTKDQIRYSVYTNGRIGIIIAENNEVIAKATINLPNEILGEDEVFIKNWSENEGILEDLIEMGIISTSLDWVKTGFTIAHKCKLLVKPND